MASNVSEDLLWYDGHAPEMLILPGLLLTPTREITNRHNSYTLKQRSGGRVLLSRDPLNLTNKHSRKYIGVARNQVCRIFEKVKSLGSVADSLPRPLASKHPHQTKTASQRAS